MLLKLPTTWDIGDQLTKDNRSTLEASSHILVLIRKNNPRIYALVAAPLQYVQELQQISLHLKSVWSEVLLSFWLKFLVTGRLYSLIAHDQQHYLNWTINTMSLFLIGWNDPWQLMRSEMPRLVFLCNQGIQRSKGQTDRLLQCYLLSA